MQTKKLVEKCHETRWVHVPDPDKSADLKLADPSCRHCHGTGVAGQLVLTGGKPAVREKINEPLYERMQLTCKCVVRREVEKGTRPS